MGDARVHRVGQVHDVPLPPQPQVSGLVYDVYDANVFRFDAESGLPAIRLTQNKGSARRGREVRDLGDA